MSISGVELWIVWFKWISWIGVGIDGLLGIILTESGVSGQARTVLGVQGMVWDEFGLYWVSKGHSMSIKVSKWLSMCLNVFQCDSD